MSTKKRKRVSARAKPATMIDYTPVINAFRPLLAALWPIVTHHIEKGASRNEAQDMALEGLAQCLLGPDDRNDDHLRDVSGALNLVLHVLTVRPAEREWPDDIVVH